VQSGPLVSRAEHSIPESERADDITRDDIYSDEFGEAHAGRLSVLWRLRPDSLV
jgi:hypothetical protein